MQDEITSDLARLTDLKVVGSQSTGWYVASKEPDLRAIGRDLGVRCSRVTSGEPICEMRVSIRLVDLRDCDHPLD